MIHQFILNGYYIVLDVNSGAVHVLDNMTYELVKYCSEKMQEDLPREALSALDSRFSPADLGEAWKELYALYQNGQLYSIDDYGKYREVSENSPIKSMCLNIAHDCNLRCKYCFASTGDFGGGRKQMPFEVGKAAMDFLLDHSGKRHNLEVDFFGGEPLMNFDVVKQIVVYTRNKEKSCNKNVRFTITTNGLLLDDDKIDFINREMHNVVLSVDGRREINDRMRIRVDGSGCYDSIMPRFKKLVDNRNQENYYVRGTFTRDNLDFSADVFHLADEGFEQISVEPVILEDTSPYALLEKDLPAIFNEYEKLALELIKRKKEGRGVNFFHFMMDLDHGPCAIKLLRGCGCGNEYVAVTPEGDIYPCHQFVGRPEYIMGNVLDKENPIKTPQLKKQFANANIFTKEGCRNCWAKFFCSGGCNANNSAYRGDILKPMPISCEMEKKRIECALMIKAALAD